jgi:hypothetical protein
VVEVVDELHLVMLRESARCVPTHFKDDSGKEQYFIMISACPGAMPRDADGRQVAAAGRVIITMTMCDCC